MAGICRVILIGNLGKDPVIRFMPSGDTVANITVATSDTWKDKQTGERKEKTEWHRIVIFGNLAEIAKRFLTKGAKVYIEGTLQTRKWTNQQGHTQYTTEVVLQGYNGVMKMLDDKPKQQEPQHRGDFQQQAPLQQRDFHPAPKKQEGYHQQTPQRQDDFQQHNRRIKVEPAIEFDL